MMRIFIVLLFIFNSGGIARACGCGEPIPFPRAESMAGEIFIGLLVRTEMYQMGTQVD